MRARAPGAAGRDSPVCSNDERDSRWDQTTEQPGAVKRLDNLVWSNNCGRTTGQPGVVNFQRGRRKGQPSVVKRLAAFPVGAFSTAKTRHGQNKARPKQDTAKTRHGPYKARPSRKGTRLNTRHGQADRTTGRTTQIL